VTRYLRVPQRTFEGRTFRLYSLRLRVLEHTVRENIARFLERSWVFALEVFGGSVTDLGVGVRSAAAAPLCSFAGLLRWIVTEDGGWSGAHVDPSLTRQVPTFWSTGMINNYTYNQTYLVIHTIWIKLNIAITFYTFILSIWRV